MDGLVYRTATQSDSDPAEFVLSDETVDRYGDVIQADGWDLRHFRKNPIALFNHNSNAVIGRWDKVRVEGKRLLGKLVLAAAGTSRLVDEVRNHWEQGNLRAVSVGFRAIEKEPLKKTDKDDDPFSFGPFRFLRSELVECSLVAVPANPNALPVGRSFVLPADIQRQLLGKPASRDRPAGSAVPRVSAQPRNARGSPMKLSKRIEDAQKRITALKDQLTALSNKDELTEDETALMDELPDQIDEVQAELQRDMRIESALAVRTVEHDSNEGQQRQQPAGNGGDQQQRPFAVPKKKVEPIDLLIRSAAMLTMAYGRRESLQAVFQSIYGNDEATGIILRAATAPALTTTVGWAAELVETVNAGFLDRLLADSIYGPLSARGARFTFGRAGAIKIPARANSPRLAGTWVGEAQPKPVKQALFTSVTLGLYKLAVISVFSEEIAEHSTPAIEQIIRQAMSDDTSAAIDGFLIDNVAGSAVRPSGLLNGLTTLTPSADTNKTNAMIADVKALRQAIIANGGGRDVVLVMNSAQSTGIDLAVTPNGLLFSSAAEGAGRFGVALIVSNTVPAGTVIAVDAADFASATGDVPRYSISDQATIHMEDTTPLPIIGGTTGTPAPAVPTRSLWQTDSIGVRMTWPISWAMRRQGMVAFMSAVTW